MFFRQAVGRFVRRQPDEEHAALVFAPALPGLRVMAAQIEAEIQHEIDREREELEREDREGSAEREGDGQQLGPDSSHVPIGASDPVLEGIIYGGQEYTPEENTRAEALLRKHGFPASSLAALRKLVREDLASPQPVAVPQPVAEAIQAPVYRMKKTLKAELNKQANRLVSAEFREYRSVQLEINQFMGVRKRDQATTEQLKQGIDYVMKRLGDLR